MATIAALVTAAAGAYGAYSTSQNQKKAANTAAGMSFGRTPKAAEYEPVDFDEAQLQSILGNIDNMDEIRSLVRHGNDALTGADLRRAKKLIPGYKTMMQQQGTAASALLDGRLPYDDVLDIVAERATLTGALGTPGTAAPATLRDLGMSRLSAIDKGQNMMKGMVDIAERISPINRYMRPSDFVVNPLDRIRLTMDQNQLIQQSEQSRYNLEAGISPTQQAQQMLSLSNASRPDPNYAQYAVQALGALAQRYEQNQAAAGTMNTTYSGSAGPNGSTYVGSFGSTPVYRPQNPYSAPA